MCKSLCLSCLNRQKDSSTKTEGRYKFINTEERHVAVGQHHINTKTMSKKKLKSSIGLRESRGLVIIHNLNQRNTHRHVIIDWYIKVFSVMSASKQTGAEIIIISVASQLKFSQEDIFSAEHVGGSTLKQSICPMGKQSSRTLYRLK